MNYTPCEYIVWNRLPIIRKEIALCMVEKFGYNQTETAKKLNITRSAVSQYFTGKRGKYNINDKKIREWYSYPSTTDNSTIESEVEQDLAYKGYTW